MNRAPILLSLLACIAFQATAAAQDKGKKKAEPPKVDPRLAEQLASPRSTVETFLGAMNDTRLDVAVKCLDLSKLDTITRSSKKKELAVKLKRIIDRMARLDTEKIRDDGENIDHYILGDLLSDDLLALRDIQDAQNLELVKDTNGLWRFSARTVSKIDEMWGRWREREKKAGFGDESGTFGIWLEDRFPKQMRRTYFLLPTYQWICLVIAIFLGFVADLAVRLLLQSITAVWLKYMKAEVDDKIRQGLWRPVGLLVQGFTWYWGTQLIDLPRLVLLVLTVFVKFLTVVAAVWTAFRLIDLLSSFLAKKAARTETKFDDVLIPLLSKTLKTAACCIGLVLFADMFELQWKAVLGGIGLGGMAIAFAAKDTLGNLFGSLTVLTDRPFEIGDWVITEGIEGTVETVGIRSTRIRTFYNSLITVPNSRLTTAIVDNMGRRQYRRINVTLGVEFSTTPEQIEAMCEGIRELIRTHPDTRKDYFHVYFKNIGAASLDIMVYCFLECSDWGVELHGKHTLFADILRVAEELKVNFAFPTQTLHMFQEDDPPPPPQWDDPVAAGKDAASDVRKAS